MEHSALSFDRGGQKPEGFELRWCGSDISGSKGTSMFDEISLSGEKAIKLRMSDSFPSDNRFGLRFYDGNELGEDEAITSGWAIFRIKG